MAETENLPAIVDDLVARVKALENLPASALPAGAVLPDSPDGVFTGDQVYNTLYNIVLKYFAGELPTPAPKTQTNSASFNEKTGRYINSATGREINPVTGKDVDPATGYDIP